MDRFLDEKKVAEITGRSVHTLRHERMQRIGIPFCKLQKSVRYRESDVLEYMNKHIVDTNDPINQ